MGNMVKLECCEVDRSIRQLPEQLSDVQEEHLKDKFEMAINDDQVVVVQDIGGDVVGCAVVLSTGDTINVMHDYDEVVVALGWGHVNLGVPGYLPTPRTDPPNYYGVLSDGSGDAEQ